MGNITSCCRPDSPTPAEGHERPARPHPQGGPSTTTPGQGTGTHQGGAPGFETELQQLQQQPRPSSAASGGAATGGGPTQQQPSPANPASAASGAQPNHEAAFHQWNDGLTQQFTAAHPGVNSSGGSMLRYPLYRASQQKPADVFQPGGALQPSSVLNGRAKNATFDLSKHQTGLPSQYTSMTTSLPATQGISQFLRRDNVFVTDPQPQGRYLNGRPNANLTPGAFNQHEVSVPGSIPTASVRGSIPVNQTTGELDYSGLRKNDHYQPPESYRREYADAEKPQPTPTTPGESEP